jgi:hypothetical protein
LIGRIPTTLAVPAGVEMVELVPAAANTVWELKDLGGLLVKPYPRKLGHDFL